MQCPQRPYDCEHAGSGSEAALQTAMKRIGVAARRRHSVEAQQAEREVPPVLGVRLEPEGQIRKAEGQPEGAHGPAGAVKHEE